MIDYFALALTHGLLALACWRILLRSDLDAEAAPTAPTDPQGSAKAQRRA